MKKKKISSIVLAVILVIAVCAAIVIHAKDDDELSSQEIMNRIEDALGDEYKKQSVTEVAATLVYGNGVEEENIYYHVLKTTYYEAEPAEGLNVDAFKVLFDPDRAESCKEMMIQDWDAALYKTSGHSYLCWTYSPDVSYILEYNPDAIAEEEIIKIAESAKLVED